MFCNIVLLLTVVRLYQAIESKFTKIANQGDGIPYIVTPWILTFISIAIDINFDKTYSSANIVMSFLCTISMVQMHYLHEAKLAAKKAYYIKKYTESVESKKTHYTKKHDEMIQQFEATKTKKISELWENHKQ